MFFTTQDYFCIILNNEQQACFKDENAKLAEHLRFYVNRDDQQSQNNGEILLATAGKDFPLTVYRVNLSCQKFDRVFVAKRENDELDLAIPVHSCDLQFVDPNRIVVMDLFGSIKVYDIKNKKGKPVVDVNPTKTPFKHSAIITESTLALGDTRGTLDIIELSRGRVLGRCSGATGAITGLACDNSRRYLFSISADRHLRVHEISTRKLLSSVDLQHIPSALCLVEPPCHSRDDGLWSNMETIE